jgi:hypothetical protein
MFGTSGVSSGSKAAADFGDGSNDRPSVPWKARKPWQDRGMLSFFAARPNRLDALTAASRHLAHGFRPFAKTMKDNRNVRYPSC